MANPTSFPPSELFSPSGSDDVREEMYVRTKQEENM